MESSGEKMADKRCDMLDQIEGKTQKICDKGCVHFRFPHLECACVLSQVFSVNQGEGCYIYEEKQKTLSRR